MNTSLIEHNIRQLEQQVQQGQAEEASKIALTLARLMLQTPSQTSLRSLYGAYAGVVAALQTCFDTLLENYSPTQDIAQMEEKIQQVQAHIEQCAQEGERIAQTSRELLEKEQELQHQKAALEAQKEQIQNLIAIKEREIPQLQQEIQEKKELLQNLEEQCTVALEEKSRWMQVFNENNRLIADLPDRVMDQDADAIIAAAKAYAQQAKLANEEGDEWLRKVIEAVRLSKEKMKTQQT